VILAEHSVLVKNLLCNVLYQSNEYAQTPTDSFNFVSCQIKILKADQVINILIDTLHIDTQYMKHYLNNTNFVSIQPQ